MLLCAENVFVAHNSRLREKNAHDNATETSEESTEIDKTKTQILELQQQLAEIKQTVENNRQEVIGIVKYLKNYVNEQIEKSSKPSSDEDDQETEEKRSNVTFGGQSSYKSRQNNKENQETEKKRPNVTFGGQNPYRSRQRKRTKKQKRKDLMLLLADRARINPDKITNRILRNLSGSVLAIPNPRMTANRKLILVVLSKETKK